MPMASKPGASRNGLKEFDNPHDQSSEHLRRCMGPMTWVRFQALKSNFSLTDQEHIERAFAALKERAE